MTRLLLLTITVLTLCFTTSTAQNLPSPKEHFGFDIGDNYKLANYTQTEAYFKEAKRLRSGEVGRHWKNGRRQNTIHDHCFFTGEFEEPKQVQRNFRNSLHVAERIDNLTRHMHWRGKVAPLYG